MSRKYDHSPKRKQTKRKLTSNQQEWKHQVTNLKRRIRDLQGLGVQVAFDIPSMPSKVTKQAINKIKNIKREELLKFAFTVYAYGEVGEAFIPKRGERKEYRRHIKEARELEKQAELAKIEAENDRIQNERILRDLELYRELAAISDDEVAVISEAEFENLKSMIDDFGDPAITGQLKDMIEAAINEDGMEDVFNRIEGKLSNLQTMAFLATKYKGTSKSAGAITTFAQLIFGRALSLGELKAFERANDYNDDFEELE